MRVLGVPNELESPTMLTHNLQVDHGGYWLQDSDLLTAILLFYVLLTLSVLYSAWTALNWAKITEQLSNLVELYN